MAEQARRARLDTSTDRGKHVESRLRGDIIAWLTTVRPNGQLDTVPVWFLWDSERVLIYSRPNAPKMRNLEGNSHVTVVVDDTRGGGDVIRIEGTAEYVADHPHAHEVPAYVEKYASGIQYIGYDPESFSNAYSAAIIVTPAKYRV